MSNLYILPSDVNKPKHIYLKKKWIEENISSSLEPDEGERGGDTTYMEHLNCYSY